jgi:DNA-binding LacI/PurR family transcriptional regulator
VEARVEEARSGAGPRKVTLEDVAKAAGVSRALVSIVVRRAPGASDETRARILAIADELGYRPDVRARLLARSSSRLLGVAFSVNSLHHADLVPSIYDAAEAHGYEVILSGRTPRHDEKHAIDTLIGYRCDAIIDIAPEQTEADLSRLSRGLPVVVVGRRIAHQAGTVDVVRTDEASGLQQAVEHLAGLGHRRIAHIDGGPGQTTMTADRRRFFRATMDRLGLRATCSVVDGGNTGPAGRAAAGVLLASDAPPTAIVTFNDEAAWGAMRAIFDAGLRVPEDVSVVGYDGTTLAEIAPHRLTTVRQDFEAIGRLSVERAIARLEEGAPVGDAVLEPALKLGETSGPAPAFTG